MIGLFKTATIFLATLFSIFAPEAQKVEVKDMVGKQIPSFEMTTVDGKKVNNSTLKGKPFILDFWATWCGPCKKASPVMESIFQKYGKKGLVVIGANGLEDEEGPKFAKDYQKEHKYTYTFTHTNDKLMSKWGIVGVPTFIFVDKSGKVVKVQIGFGESLEKDFDSVAGKLVSSK